MAKTFKTVSRPESGPVQKPISERDFFDLTDESALPAASPRQVSHPISAGNTDNRRSVDKGDNTSNTGNISENSISGNADNTGNTAAASSSALAMPTAAGGDVRQTFVLSSSYLEQLRDYVHARRAQGDYTYSQKQALQEALALLFADAAPAQPRPAQVREREQQHRQRIQEGRQAAANG